ncbi:hypothetical protein [Meiothermus granaticius]|uniref:Calcineurin-like phosphoesterase n=1 Tax=Meiothermus granaticius NBRC 107808 TaxID=1227551 RepID=A0A399FBM0_9DEIN|nr:hypothetical protein [Meiothermus granaticius]RIH93997.1 hypothetical protein Mgrana_00083 [Meiothermus granaticius NBRC 107808]GEM88174.1 hypothetical protein MGR01S_27990 [Meiothermus granaticius NBRC 107808]
MAAKTVCTEEQALAAAAELARAGRKVTPASVRNKLGHGGEVRYRLILEANGWRRGPDGYTHPDHKAAEAQGEPDFERDRAEQQRLEMERLRARVKTLEREYERALQEVNLIDRLIDRVMEAAPLSYQPLGRYVAPLRNPKTPVSKLLMLSDTHVGKVVEPDQTLGYGGYNTEIFVDRLAALEDAVLSILEGHTANPVEQLVVVMLGDMLDGALSHANEADQTLTLFDQWFTASHALAQFLRNLAAHVPVMDVYTAVGNHTRWQNQRKMPSVNRYSNLDHFLYHHIAALTRDVRNICWHLDKQPFAVFAVQGWTFMAGHGEHLRGGDRALGIPAHAVNRHVNTQTQLALKAGRPVPAYHLFGDKHKSVNLPHALGEVVFNGSFVGVDNYALASGFTPVPPTQELFEVHPRYGRTGIYPLKLQHATLGGGNRYLEALATVRSRN